MASESCKEVDHIRWGHPPNIPSAQRGEFPFWGWGDTVTAKAVSFFLESAEHCPQGLPRRTDGLDVVVELRGNGLQVDPALGARWRCVRRVRRYGRSCHSRALQPDLSCRVLHLYICSECPLLHEKPFALGSHLNFAPFLGGLRDVEEKLAGCPVVFGVHCQVRIAYMFDAVLHSLALFGLRLALFAV